MSIISQFRKKKKEKHSTIILYFTLEVFMWGLSIREKKITLQVTTERVYKYNQLLKQMETLY